MNKLHNSDVEQKINQLLQLLLIQPQHSIEEIIKLIGKKLLTFLRLLLNNQQDAEDVFQEVFTIILHKIKENSNFIKSIHNPKNWIYTIAKNQALQLLRKKKIERKHLLDVTNSHQVSNTFCSQNSKSINPESSIIYEDLYNAINKLPIDLKVPLLMCDCLDLTYAEIAQITDQNVNQVASDIYRARKLLKEIFNKH